MTRTFCFTSQKWVAKQESGAELSLFYQYAHAEDVSISMLLHTAKKFIKDCYFIYIVVPVYKLESVIVYPAPFIFIHAYLVNMYVVHYASN